MPLENDMMRRIAWLSCCLAVCTFTSPQHVRAQDLTADIVVALFQGNYDEGIALLARAIEQNPNDAGQNYKPSSMRALSPEALEHGRKQFLRMLQDRPNMGKHTDENDILGKWAIRKFAGEDTGVTIDWDPTLPQSGMLAEHRIPTPDQRGAIRIAKIHPSEPRQGSPLTFEELWHGVVFELHNIMNAKEFLQLHNGAVSGEHKRDDYILNNFRLEHKALQRTRAFYCHVYLPWAKEKQLRTAPAQWYVTLWGGAEKWLEQRGDHFAFLERYYGQHYDFIRRSVEEAGNQ